MSDGPDAYDDMGEAPITGALVLVVAEGTPHGIGKFVQVLCD